MRRREREREIGKGGDVVQYVEQKRARAYRIEEKVAMQK